MLHLFIGLLLSLGTSVQANDSFRLPLPEIETFPNGLKVVWFIDDKLPLLDLALLVETGQRDDPVGRSGTVELMSRLLERGSNGKTALEMAQRVERLGASGFADADDEGITLGLHGLSQDSEILLETLAWMALRPNFSSDDFIHERDRLKEYWKHLLDSAESISNTLFARLILKKTPYSRGALANLDSLERVSLESIKKFHAQNFSPDRSVLMVVGRVDREKFRKRISSYFGDWKKVPRSNRKVGLDPIHESKWSRFRTDTVQVVDMPGLPQAQIRIGFKIPGVQWKKRHALAVANSLLGEYFNSRLMRVVRDEQGLAYGIQSSLIYYRDHAFLSIHSATQPAQAGKLLDETFRQLRFLKSGDATQEEVSTAKNYLVGGFPLSVASLGSVASRWLSGYVFRMGPDFLNEYIPKVRDVSYEQVQEALSEAIPERGRVIVVCGDAKEIEKGLREYGFKKIQKWKAKDLF